MRRPRPGPAAAALLAGLLLAAAPARRALGAAPAAVPPLTLGSSWYPEQWPESRWDADLALMRAAGLRMVRVGEFAWSSLEPEEGRYTFDWLERAIAHAAAHGIVVVIGTPTDSPPAWLTREYPEVLRVDADGRTVSTDMRRQFSYSSPKYRELCRDIVSRLAERFGRNADVVGWQIGNEYTEDSHDAGSRRLFEAWLRAKYGTLDNLNARWTTAYWSETYDRWDEIPIPADRANPGLLLDYKRFVTDEWLGFQQNQIDAIRRFADPRQFVTTNLGGLGWADRFNRRTISAPLDFVSWDDYVGQGHVDPVRNGATDDLVRGWKRRNFWVMEMQPGFVDWAPVSNCLDPGETRAMAWEDVGHGADAIAFWQWRSALNGQEQYHGTLVGPGGEPLPFYAEAKRLGADFARAGAALAGTEPDSDVAILHDYDSRWAIDFHPQSVRYDQIAVLLGYYRALRRFAPSVDIVDPRADLSRYRLVLAPSLNVISAALARHLEDYAASGGHLVLGPRSGMKDEYDSLNPESQPGPLAATLGGRVDEYYALLDDVPVGGAWGGGRATVWAERLSVRAPDARVLMRYGPHAGWLSDEPAAISRPCGRGAIAYLGAVLDTALTARVVAGLAREAGVPPAPFAVPEGVEVCRRMGEGRTIYVLVNFGSGLAQVALPAPMTDVLEGGTVGRVDLPRYGVAVLQAGGG